MDSLCFRIGHTNIRLTPFLVLYHLFFSDCSTHFDPKVTVNHLFSCSKIPTNQKTITYILHILPIFSSYTSRLRSVYTVCSLYSQIHKKYYSLPFHKFSLFPFPDVRLSLRTCASFAQVFLIVDIYRLHLLQFTSTYVAVVQLLAGIR